MLPLPDEMEGLRVSSLPAMSQAVAIADPIPDFAAALLRWHAHHGRHDLPWVGTREPYRVWLSEIMLQQTQVASVVPYYQRFLGRLPTLATLAAAPVDEVMALWSGLGYYARARNLHACAQQVMMQYGGEFPRRPEAIAALPGIGRSTANAIAAFCFGARVPILDGNVKRVLARSHGIEGYPGQAAVEQRLWGLAEQLLPRAAADTPAYIQAQMDLGATVCTRARPDCARCPLAGRCVAFRDGRCAELPQPRPRKVLPQRTLQVLLIDDGQRWLFERRPPSGIWGGLLSLPELAVEADPQALARQLGCPVEAFTSLPAVRHTFTHFQLTLLPLRARIQSQPQLQSREADALRWLTPAEAVTAALPRPIRDIIASGERFLLG